MTPKRFGSDAVKKFSWQRLWLLPMFALITTLVTGCPHNEYTVELKPQGNALERSLTFYRADGTDSNGVPGYLEFPTNELAAILKCYPAQAVKKEGKKFVASGVFTNAMPGDVGGNGHFTNFVTSLGQAGFYLERFRGNDDLAARTERQFAVADQLTDLAIGWAKTEFGREPGWKHLQKFLDKDFRHDLKNAGLYFWTAKVCDLNDTNTSEEFVARFTQYLLERNYIRPADLPVAYSGSEAARLHLFQRIVAEKLEVPAGGSPPKSLAILTNTAALENSCSNYLAKSDLYRTRVKQWQQKHKTDPNLKQPEPNDLPGELLQELLEPLDLLGASETDHLVVKLALARAPEHSNGKWQDGQVVWDIQLDSHRALPAVCYASWSTPEADFQTARFGKVILDGDPLTEYCVWQAGLGTNESSEWNQFLSALKPGPDLPQKILAFHFSSEPASGPVGGKAGQPLTGAKLLADALAK